MTEPEADVPMLAGPPPVGYRLPGSVVRLAAGDPMRPVWLNQLGGLTCELGADERRRFVKWAPRGSMLDLHGEATRMRWAAAFTAVPRVLDVGHDDDGSWIVTTPVPGSMAVLDRWKREPLVAVIAIGAGLRAIHDALPVDFCPFSWNAVDRVADARRRAAAGLVNPGRWHPDHRHLDVEQALRLLAEPPPADQLVVCHGDACAPNTLIDDAGRCSGHVDLGSLGVGDRWADLAIATWSTTWNYGPGWERPLLDAYGVPPDDERIRYYRLLWDLGP